MPRSVNSVASRARRKRVLKLAKGYWGRRKNVWTVSKNAVEKGLTYASEIEKLRRESSESCGFRESTQVLESTACLIHSLWVK